MPPDVNGHTSRQLGEQERRSLRGQDPVPLLVTGDRAGNELERAVHERADPTGQPASDRAGHNQGADDADRRGKYQQGTDGGGYIAGGDRDRHGNLLGSRWTQRWTATVTRTRRDRLLRPCPAPLSSVT
jgi:hypothetical protein